jgi:hypothetical protein
MSTRRDFSFVIGSGDGLIKAEAMERVNKRLPRP